MFQNECGVLIFCNEQDTVISLWVNLCLLSNAIIPKSCQKNLSTTLNHPRVIHGLFTFTGDYCTIHFTFLFIYLLAFLPYLSNNVIYHTRKNNADKKKALSLLFCLFVFVVWLFGCFFSCKYVFWPETPFLKNTVTFFSILLGFKIQYFCESEHYAICEILKYYYYIYTPHSSKTDTRTNSPKSVV